MSNKQNGDKIIKTEDTLKMLVDIKALECDILQDLEYVCRYHFIDDAIRNKGPLILISPFNIVAFSKLSQCISNSYRYTETMESTISNIKPKIIENLAKGNHLSNIMTT